MSQRMGNSFQWSNSGEVWELVGVVSEQRSYRLNDSVLWMRVWGVSELWEYELVSSQVKAGVSGRIHLISIWERNSMRVNGWTCELMLNCDSHHVLWGSIRILKHIFNKEWTHTEIWWEEVHMEDRDTDGYKIEMVITRHLLICYSITYNLHRMLRNVCWISLECCY
jgi:hypothetical protein